MAEKVCSTKINMASGTSVGGTPGNSSAGMNTQAQIGSGNALIGSTGNANVAFTSASSMKPVPMKLFSSWEVDRAPSNCIPRLCTLTLTRLVVLKPLLASDTSSVIIAVKMAGSRRTLRSNEILLSSNGLTDTELELNFSLQYPHFLKRDENRLFIMLQRRKKYKNRTILGYKTLAEGTVDMALVLQRSLDMELSLSAAEGGNKENIFTVAKVTILGLSSQPIDELEGDRKSKASGLRRQLSSPMNPTAHDSAGKEPRNLANDFSDDDDDFSSHSSDSPPDDVIIRKTSKMPHSNRNLKQKIVNLLRKFKASEEGQQSESKTCDPVGDIDELFLDELEGLSDSEPDADTLSMGSFPKKPVLPPFFASSKSLVQQNALNTKDIELPSNLDDPIDSDSWTEPDQPSGESPKLKLRSVAAPFVFASAVPQNANQAQNLNGRAPRSSKLASISDQLLSVLPPDDNFPDLVVFVSIDGPGIGIFSSLADSGVKVLGIESEADLRVALPHLIGKVQKFCNNNAKTPPPTCFVVAGNETLLSGITKSYVAQLTSKPHDWQTFFSFCFIPYTTGGSIWRLLCANDLHYAQSFNEFVERVNPDEFAHRLISYVKTASERRQLINLPIAEAMITYKDSDESSQIFVPFISEVRLNLSFCSGPSVDVEGDLSSSPPSPPHSPREDSLELQVDYWKGSTKSSIKSFFRTLSIQRSQDNGLSVTYALKEQKKQKIMRLGKKKERESDTKNLTMEGISRLVCLAKSQYPMKLFVDGVEWTGVKFFQVSSQWQSQVKHLPLLISSQGKSDV